MFSCGRWSETVDSFCLICSCRSVNHGIEIYGVACICSIFLNDRSTDERAFFWYFGNSAQNEQTGRSNLRALFNCYAEKRLFDELFLDNGGGKWVIFNPRFHFGECEVIIFCAIEGPSPSSFLVREIYFKLAE